MNVCYIYCRKCDRIDEHAALTCDRIDVGAALHSDKAARVLAASIANRCRALNALDVGVPPEAAIIDALI